MASVPPPPLAYGYAPERQPGFASLAGAPDAAPVAPPPAPLTLGQQAAAQTAPPAASSAPRALAPAASAAPPLPPAPVPSREPRESSLAQAAQVGAAAASNAAAGPPVASAAPTAAPAARARVPGDAALLELCWFDPERAPRLRKTPAWSGLFQPPPRKPAPQRGAPPPPAEPSSEAEGARADFVAVLMKATPFAPDAVESALEEALGEGGTLTPPLVVLAGEIELTLDGAALLAATIAAATPLAAADKRLKETLDLCAETTKGDPPPPDVIESLLARVRDAWSKANRALPASYLDTQSERTLLEQRRYQKRTLLDAEWIRGLWHGSGSAEGAIPAYLPAALEKRLPLFRRFAARLIAETLPQQDQYEAHPLALRVVALARVVRGRQGARG
jgi:hypothetical protein